MKKCDWRTWMGRLPLLVAGLAAPTAFPLSQMGYGTLHQFGLYLVLPAALFLAVAWFVSRKTGGTDTAKLLADGAAAGALATLALEAVRFTGFKLGFMPGNLPELMGVLLADRFALGPSATSTIAGFAYHFWNGASFGLIFTVMRMNLSNRWAVVYGIAIGIGFLASPVVQAMGVGPFGIDFGWRFAATVLTAHAAFGAALAWLLSMLEARCCYLPGVTG